MLCDYDKSERAQMERDARNKQELEYYTRLNADLKEAKETARAEGIASMVKNMYDSGMKKEDIAKICKLDLVFVNEVLTSEW